MSRARILSTGVFVAVLGAIGFIALRRSPPPSAQTVTPPSPAASAKVGATPPISSVKPAKASLLLESASADEWTAALRQRMAGGATADEILGDLKFLLAREPGLAIDLALALAPSGEEKYTWTSVLLAQWAAIDPDAAWGRTLDLERNHTVQGEPPLLAVVLGRVAQLDPDRVVSFADKALAAEPPPEGGGASSGDVVLAATRALLGAQRPEMARSALERWSASPITAELLGNAPFEEVALDLARRSRPDAGEWLRTLPPSTGRNFALATLAADWATVAPADAMTWATSLDPQSGRSDAIQRAFNRWADSDIVAAAQWVAEHEASPQADTLIANLVSDSSLSHVAPERALQWSELIRDPAARQASVERVIMAWSESDAAAATKFATQTSLLPSDARQRIVDLIRRRGASPQE